MKSTTNKLPGKWWRFLSFIPLFNWISLLYIGIINSSAISIICAVMYCFVIFVFPSFSFELWIVCIVHYHFAYRSIQNQKNKSVGTKTTLPEFSPQQKDTKKIQGFSDRTISGETEQRQVIPPRTLSPDSVISDSFTVTNHRSEFSTLSSKSSPQHEDSQSIEEIQGFFDITIPGETEQREAIPPRPISPDGQIHSSFSPNSSQSTFFSDIQKYASFEGRPARFVPFQAYWPTYDSMNAGQKAWYFYWRSRLRQGNYLDTDLSYIFIFIYELLSGVGWQAPKEGYDCLLRIWSAYRNRFPDLDRYLSDWTFDFAQLHGLEYTVHLESNSARLIPSAMTDFLIEQHAEDIPLQLQFSLIDALCDYSLTKSKFYNDNNQGLMQEAIPRVVALADAVLRTKSKMGILETYGPRRPRTQVYYAFKSAVCPQANTKSTLSVKAYSKSQRLREYMNELVRYSENVLRELRGYRGRLRGGFLDDETANLIKSFLENEYGTPVPQTSEGTKKFELNLNFENINILREQSNAVRTALHVEESIAPDEKARLTDIHEVTTLYLSLSSEARLFLDRLKHSSWECEQMPEDEVLIHEINRLARHYLGYALLVKEENIVMAEDDYRDELTYMYENPPQIPEIKDISRQFDLSVLPSELRAFVEYLVPEQQKALHALLTCEQPQSELERIAEESMTMPQILLDQINEAAMQILGDLLVDFVDQEPHISCEYITLLKQSNWKGVN